MFITFEGLDFCGKSTQVSLLKAYLESISLKTLLLREPGGTEISEKIRDILLDKKNFRMVMEAELLLFSASRAQLVRDVIIPKLNEGFIVISDRFHDSTTAYQGFGRGIDLDFITKLNSFVIQNALPDITFFIDITVDEAKKRKEKNQFFNLDRIEISNDDFYQKVRNGYLYSAEKEKRFFRIDGTKSIDEIHNEIKEKINFMLEVKRGNKWKKYIDQLQY